MENCKPNKQDIELIFALLLDEVRNANIIIVINDIHTLIKPSATAVETKYNSLYHRLVYVKIFFLFSCEYNFNWRRNYC